MFDLSMFNPTNVMIGLLVVVGLILLYLAFLAWRNPVLVKIGLRNIPRRPSQSILIVIGLTLSTIIIMSSLSTGDTLSYSMRTHAVQAYGQVDEIIAPPLISLFATLDTSTTFEEAAAENEQAEELNRLMEGGLTSVLTVLEGGLPSITTQRLEQLKAEAIEEPTIDAVAGSIVFPTIIRNTNTGQGEPLGFIFAVDNDYDERFGLNNIEGTPVEMESLQTGVGNIFVQASNLFSMAGDAGANLGLEDVSISDVAMATAAVGAALTGGAAEEGLDLAEVRVDVATLREMGIDTTFLEEQGLEEVSLESLGLTEETLEQMGVTTTTVTAETLGIDSSATQTVTTQFMQALNLNTLGRELDSVLAQAGLQLRQGDVYLSRMGAERLDAQVGDVLEIYIGPLPLPFRVKAIIDQAGPMGALAPVVMLRLDEAQKLLFMRERVNTILVSNQGNELEGLEHTQEASRRLSILAQDPAIVARIDEILRQPHAQAALQDQLDEFQTEFEEEYEGPPFMRDFLASMAGESTTKLQVEELSASLEQPQDIEHLRTLLVNTDLRTWLLDLPLPADDLTALRSALGDLNQFDVVDPLSKSSIVRIADLGGVAFTSVFSVFGILSIVAGVLLIFLIFVMMAAERRSELGMARAIGVQRRHLVQMFVTEGVVYDLAAAAIGVLLGLGISYAMVGFIGNLFNTATEQLAGQSALFRIRFHATPPSIVIAYCLGVLFTFAVVTGAAWRVSRLNIVAAMRDLDEPPGRARTSRWGRTLRLLFGPMLFILGGVLIVNGFPSDVSLMQIGASLFIAGLAFLLGWLLEQRDQRAASIQRVVYTIIGLSLLIIWSLPWTRWTDALGISSVTFSAWPLVGFILGGPLLILGSILVIMFNADILSWLVSRLLGGIGALTPVLKTAIAYPLSSRFRTGMAMLLFAMIISTVTLMTVVIEATQTLVAPDSQRNAGFDIQVNSSLLSFFDPLDDLEAELPAKPDYPLDDVAAVGAVTDYAAAARQIYPRAGRDNVDREANLVGVNEGYVQQAAAVYTLDRRNPDYATDAEVWDALHTRTDVAVVTPDQLCPFETGSDTQEGNSREEVVQNRAPGGRPDRHDRDDDDDFNFEDPRLSNLWPLCIGGSSPDGAQLAPTTIRLWGEDDTTHDVTIIGVIAESTTLAGSGVWVNRSLVDTVAGEPVNPDSFYLKVREGADVHAVAQATERAFLNNAVNATVMAESFAQAQALTRGILQLFQGFLALGLLVGIAALGVISTRTVVERRQQVGMLRAIGFQPGMVALSFLLESSFIALTGILVGTATGILLGRTLVSNAYASLADAQVFTVPWGEIGVIVLIAYGFALLTTIIPALQASRIYPAEALRYE